MSTYVCVAFSTSLPTVVVVVFAYGWFALRAIVRSAHEIGIGVPRPLAHWRVFKRVAVVFTIVVVTHSNGQLDGTLLFRVVYAECGDAFFGWLN